MLGVSREQKHAGLGALLMPEQLSLGLDRGFLSYTLGGSPQTRYNRLSGDVTLTSSHFLPLTLIYAQICNHSDAGEVHGTKDTATAVFPPTDTRTATFRSVVSESTRLPPYR